MTENKRKESFYYSLHLLPQRRWCASAFTNSTTSITHKNPNGTQIVQHSYTYDNTNNIVEYLNSIDGSTTYNYDFLGQLIGADYANQNLSDETYTYDENGNRITANGDTYTTGDNNELTSDGTWSYTYDAEGNRISKTNATNRELYTWDHRNRLTSVTQQEWDSTEQEWVTVQTIEYAYDYNNVWIRKVIGNNKTIFIPENYQTTVQIDNNVTTHHYLWTPNQQDKLLADTTPNSTSWALTDHLGTIRDILGATTTHLIYDAFGNLTSGTNPILFGYTGKPFDADTALQNNINRWYDPIIGRWLSIDPIGFEGNDANLYRYVENSCHSNDYMGWEEKVLPRISGECKIFVHIGHGWPFSINSKLLGWDYTFGDFMNKHEYDCSGLQCNGGLFYCSSGCWSKQNNRSGWSKKDLNKNFGTSNINPVEPICPSHQVPDIPLSRDKMEKKDLINKAHLVTTYQKDN